MPCELCDDGLPLPCGYCTAAAHFRNAVPKKEPSREQELSEWDSRMAAARASVAPVNPRTKGAPQAGASPETPAVRKGGRRRKRPAMPRTPEQIARAAERERLEQQGRDWWSELGTAVEGQQQDEADFVASLKDTDA